MDVKIARKVFMPVVILVLGIAVLVAAGGCRNRTEVREVKAPPPIEKPAPSAEATQEALDAARSWIELLSTAMRNCEANCTIDYQALHEYEGHSYGIMVVAWRDSEYIIDLYRYDSGKKKWTDAPTFEADYGEAVDTATASKQWGVPQNEILKWINEADDAMGKKYNRE
jgi:hypothetical protein